MCELCDERHGLRNKDRELLVTNGQTTRVLPHGITVTVNHLSFRNARRSPPEIPGNRVEREISLRNYTKPVGPEYIDSGYFYVPYVPVTNFHRSVDPKRDGHHGNL